MKKRLADIIFSTKDGGEYWVERPVIVADDIYETIEKSTIDFATPVTTTSLMPPFDSFIWEAAAYPIMVGASVGLLKPLDESWDRLALNVLFFFWDSSKLVDMGTETIYLDQNGFLEQWSPASDFTTAIGHVLLYTLSFLNCRNIELVEHRPSAVLSRKHERKYGVPLTKYYELGIKGFSKRYPASGNKVERFTPHHIVRGHFKTYTPEKPRFGRPGEHGRFWVDSFAKGDKEAGEIKKRWRVQPE